MPARTSSAPRPTGSWRRAAPAASSATCSGACPPRTSRPTRAQDLADLALARPRAPRRRPGARAQPADLSRSATATVERDGRPRELTDRRGRQRQPAVPARFDPGRADRAGPDAAPRRPPDPRRRARRGGRPGPGGRRDHRRRPWRRSRARASSTSISTGSMPARPAPASSRASPASIRDVALATDDHDAMAGAARRPRRGLRRAPRRPCRRPRSPRRAPSSTGSRDGHFTLLGMREHGLAGGGASPWSRARASGSCAIRPWRCCGAAAPLVDDDARDPRLPRRPAGADHHQGQREVPRPPGRPISTTSRVQAVLGADGTLAGEVRHRRPVHRRAPTPARPARCPYLRRKVARRWSARAGLDPTSHAGRAPPRRAGDLSARRPVPDRRRPALPLQPRHRQPRRPAAPARAVAARPLRPLRLAPRLRAEGPLRFDRARRGSAPTSPRPTAAGSRPPTRTSPKGRSPAPTTSSACPRTARPSAIPPPWRRASPPWSAPGATRCATALRGDPGRRRAPGRWPPATPRPSRRPTARTSRPRSPSPTSRPWSASSAERPRAADLGRRDTDPDAQVRLKVFSRGRRALPCPSGCRLLENLGFRVINERTYRILPPGPTRPARVWLHDMLLERATGAADRPRPRSRRPLEEALLALADGARRIRRLQPPRAGGRAGLARRRAAARARPLPAPAPHPLRPGLPRRAPSAAHPGIARAIVALFHARFDPAADGDREAGRGGDPRRDRDGARRRHQPRRGPHPAPLRQPGRGGGADQLLPDRRRTGGRRETIALQVRLRQGRAACRCRGRSSRSSSIRPASRACTCASATSPAAACAGPTGRRISAPRSWAS